MLSQTPTQLRLARSHARHEHETKPKPSSRLGISCVEYVPSISDIKFYKAKHVYELLLMSLGFFRWHLLDRGSSTSFLTHGDRLPMTSQLFAELPQMICRYVSRLLVLLQARCLQISFDLLWCFEVPWEIGLGISSQKRRQSHDFVGRELVEVLVGFVRTFGCSFVCLQKCGYAISKNMSLRVDVMAQHKEAQHVNYKVKHLTNL